jgi:hypothetical protein
MTKQQEGLSAARFGDLGGRNRVVKKTRFSDPAVSFQRKAAAQKLPGAES